MRISTTKMPPKRNDGSDIFYTDPVDIRPILQFVPKEWRIWESACGEGHIVNFLRGEGCDVTGTDIQGGFDFLSPLAPQQELWDIALTNPPYSVKDQWLERCFDLGKPFALLLPITALAGKFRGSLYRRHGIQLLVLDGRPTFTTPSGKKGGSWFDAAWFCHGLPLPRELNFVRPDGTVEI